MSPRPDPVDRDLAASHRKGGTGRVFKVGFWLIALGLMVFFAVVPPRAESKRVLIFAPGIGQEEIIGRVVALGGLPLDDRGLPQAKLVAFEEPVSRLALLRQGVVMSLISDARTCITLPEPPADVESLQRVPQPG